jgi:hypothetical protein
VSILEHERQALLRGRDVEGEIRTASFENSEHAYDHVQGGFDKEAHQHVRANAERLQMVGEVIRPLI